MRFAERIVLVAICLAFVAVLVWTYGVSSSGEAISPFVTKDERNGVEPITPSDQSATATPKANVLSIAAREDTEVKPARRFVLCYTGGGTNCVVDGDTIWVDGQKIRLADIDAPETHPPRCDTEAALGNQATTRLAELMNSGSFELKSVERNVDRYGRKLRIVTRDGRSLGDQLVREGLARTWDGRRHPWC